MVQGPEYWRHRVNEYHGVLWLSDLGHRVRLFEVRFYHRGFHTVDIVMRFIDGFGRWLDVLVSSLAPQIFPIVVQVQLSAFSRADASIQLE